MNNLTAYYNKVLQKIEKYLEKEYQSLKGIHLRKIDKVNFYLIDKALNKNQNLLIHTIQKTEKSDFYVPVIISAAISLFYKNYCNTEIKYNIGDVLQKGGRSFKIIGQRGGVYQLEYIVKGTRTVIECKEKFITRYSVVKTQLSQRKLKTTLNSYKSFFSNIFQIKEFPTQFKYKIAIILEWNDFHKELHIPSFFKDFFSEPDLFKKIPIQRFKKNGEAYKCSLPIDPMIYIVPDYYTFQDAVKDKYQIDTVILIGKNKYHAEYFEALENDIYSEEIKNVIIVGTETIQDNTGSFIKWNWTQKELSFLKEKPFGKIEYEKVHDNDFIQAIDEFYLYLKTLEKKYFIKLSDLNRFKKLLFNLVLPSENSRLLNYLNWVNDLMLKETENAIKDLLISQNIDYYEYLQEANSLIRAIFTSFSNQKLKHLHTQTRYKILLVPKRNLNIWKEDFEHRKMKVMTIGQFIKKQNNYNNNTRVLLLSLFGYELSPYELIKQISCFPHSFKFLCYNEESKDLQALKNHQQNLDNKEYSSIDRKKLTGVEFQVQVKPESISDLIGNIADKAEKDRRHHDYDSQENINYAITFEENADELILDGTKSVLLHNENRKEQIFNLLIGDKIRIYTNHTKEKLYEIALSEDTEGRFRNIDKYAALWKECLRNYFRRKIQENSDYSEITLLSDLNANGLKIKSSITIHNWLFKERDKFPSSENSLFAIKQLLKCDTLNASFNHVISARRLYRGIMLSLGRNLSEEVMDYVLTNKKSKGKILQTFTDSEVKSFVESSLPLLTIKSKSKSEEEETE